MEKQKTGGIKKTIAVLMVIFFVISLTAVLVSAADGRDGRGGGWGHGRCGWWNNWCRCGWWNNWCRWGHGGGRGW
jgi:hypothetical protein